MRTKLLARVAAAVLLLMLALVAALVALLLPGKGEPSYQGHRLSQWLKVYTLAGQRQLPCEEREPATMAIRRPGVWKSVVRFCAGPKQHRRRPWHVKRHPTQVGVVFAGGRF